MKDIKSYIIGFLTCLCMVLITGQTKAGNHNGRYQVISANKYEHFYLLDTRTGAIYTQIENPNKNTYKKRLADIWRRSPYVYEFTNPTTPELPSPTMIRW